jgi:flagellar protein FliJ
MTFRFPYTNILSIKEKEKDQAYSEYGMIVKKKSTLIEMLDSFVQDRDERIARWQDENLTSVIDIRQRSYFLEGLNEKILKIEKELLKVEEELQTKQNVFLEKRKDEQMWQHLRDKSYETYIQKEKKEEQERMDEIATIRHFHHSLSM